MKKVYSFSLSTDAYKVILNVQKERNYNSTSAALEAILLNRDITDDRLKKLMLEVLRDNQVTVTQSDKDIPVDEQINSALEESMNEIFKQLGE